MHHIASAPRALRGLVRYLAGPVLLLVYRSNYIALRCESAHFALRVTRKRRNRSEKKKVRLQTAEMRSATRRHHVDRIIRFVAPELTVLFAFLLPSSYITYMYEIILLNCYAPPFFSPLEAPNKSSSKNFFDRSSRVRSLKILMESLAEIRSLIYWKLFDKK